VPDASKAEAEFREKFRLDELTVLTDADWALSVRPGQPVVGALVVSTRHRALAFADLPASAGPSLVRMLGRAETAAKQTFAAVRINVLCLMMQDPLLHFHLLPRYDGPRDFAGRAWGDPGWPGPPTLAENQVQDDTDLRALVAAYRDAGLA